MVKQRGYKADDLFELRTVTDPQISPNGSLIACSISEIDRERDTYRSSIWLYEDGAAPRELTLSGSSNSQPRWSPDGSYLAFLSNRAGGSSQVHILPMKGGEAIQITDLKGSVYELSWSPDSKSIAFTSNVNESVETVSTHDTPSPWIITDLKYKFNGQGYFDGSKMQLFVVGLDGESPIQLTEGAYNNSQITWSPDCSSLAFISARHEDRDRDPIEDLWLITIKDRKIARLTNRFGNSSAPAFSPDGENIAFCSVGETDDIAGRVDRLWVIAATGGDPVEISKGLDRSVQAGSQMPGGPPSPIYWTADGSGLLARVHDGADIHLNLFDLDGSVSPLIVGEQCINAFSVSHQGDIASLISDQKHPGEIYRYGPAGQYVKKVSDANDEFLSLIQFPEIEPVAISMPDGASIEGWIIKPLNMKQGEKYPMVLDIHGGPHGAFQHNFQGSYPLSLPSQGCAVLQINPRGSTGWGEDFARYLHGGRGELDFPEFMAAVDQMIQWDWVDENRLGITGYSYGGYMTQWSIGQTDRFKAAVAGAGGCDLFSHFAYTDNTVPRYKEMNGPPFENLDSYMRLSPITYVQNISTPLLIMHGAADLRCNTFQSDQFFNALRYYRKDVVYVRYPGEHHGFRQAGKPSNRLDYDERLLNWFLDRL